MLSIEVCVPCLFRVDKRDGGGEAAPELALCVASTRPSSFLCTSSTDFSFLQRRHPPLLWPLHHHKEAAQGRLQRPLLHILCPPSPHKLYCMSPLQARMSFFSLIIPRSYPAVSGPRRLRDNHAAQPRLLSRMRVLVQRPGRSPPAYPSLTCITI